jgi:hypothetical protein
LLGLAATLTLQRLLLYCCGEGHRLFAAIRLRPDRAAIREEWIERAIASPIREHVQADGRIRRWTRVPEMEDRFLRVVLLADAETVHNAFFDRRFEP